MDKSLRESLLADLGLEGLPENKQEEIALSLGEALSKNIINRAMTELDPDSEGEFMRLLSEKSEDTEYLLNYLKSKVRNFPEIAEAEIAAFKKERADFLNHLYETELGLGGKE